MATRRKRRRIYPRHHRKWDGLGQGSDGGISVTMLVVTALVSAAAGGIGTVLISKLFPEATPGDGFYVRWLDETSQERRLEFGDNRPEAEAFARSIRDKFADVAVLRVSGGRIMSPIKRAKPTIVNGAPSPEPKTPSDMRPPADATSTAGLWGISEESSVF